MDKVLAESGGKFLHTSPTKIVTFQSMQKSFVISLKLFMFLMFHVYQNSKFTNTFKLWSLYYGPLGTYGRKFLHTPPTNIVTFQSMQKIFFNLPQSIYGFDVCSMLEFKVQWLKLINLIK